MSIYQKFQRVRARKKCESTRKNWVFSAELIYMTINFSRPIKKSCFSYQYQIRVWWPRILLKPRACVFAKSYYVSALEIRLYFWKYITSIYINFQICFYIKINISLTSSCRFRIWPYYYMTLLMKFLSLRHIVNGGNNSNEANAKFLSRDSWLLKIINL